MCVEELDEGGRMLSTQFVGVFAQKSYGINDLSLFSDVGKCVFGGPSNLIQIGFNLFVII